MVLGTDWLTKALLLAAKAVPAVRNDTRTATRTDMI
jgi:hypothetical protein